MRLAYLAEWRFFGGSRAILTWVLLGCLTARAGVADEPDHEVLPSGWPNSGILFVDHEAEGRSGHGGQAITESTNGDIIAFYSNVSGTVRRGHGVAGWAEYRISEDGGETWSDPKVLEPSLEAWEDPERGPILVEEVMTAADGTLVAIGRRFTDPRGHQWSSTSPVFFRSRDHGRTWSGGEEVDPALEPWQAGWPEGSMVHGDELFVLFADRSAPEGETSKHCLYVSTDNGETFDFRSVLPFGGRQWYGTIGVLPNGRVIAYSYNNDDDGEVLQYVTSDDEGRSWSEVKETPFAKRIRNPQMSGEMNGRYFMHGRSGSFGPDPRHLVLYSSEDGIHWDEGIYLKRGDPDDLDAYSTNDVIGKYDPDSPKRLLIQASLVYDESGRRVNLHHWWVETAID